MLVSGHFCLFIHIAVVHIQDVSEFSVLKSINAGYMLGSQICLELVPVYYI